MEAVEAVSITRYTQDGCIEAQDTLAKEEPLGFYLQYGTANGLTTQSVSVTMRTPGVDALLCAGFLFTEGIISKAADIASITEAAMGENTVLVKLSEGARPVLQNAERNFYTTSSCGVCGKASIEAIKVVSPFPSAINDNFRVDTETLYRLPDILRSRQDTFNSTGGLHASALFNSEGDFISLKEDVGRHNALDKLIGEAFLQNRLPLYDQLLLLSGRASFELVQKAVMAGIRFIAAIGAPSSLAVQMAKEHGVTLIGFLRGERFNVYAHGQRLR
jgi:FdhD protein